MKQPLAGRSLDIVKKKRMRAALESALGPDVDAIEFLLVNTNGEHALVATKLDAVQGGRVIIAKMGMSGGAAFGSKSATFHYGDIVNVAVQKNMVSSVVEIQTANAKPLGDFWTGLSTGMAGHGTSPVFADNTLPGNKYMFKEWEPYLTELRTLIARYKAPAAPVVTQGLAEQLGALAELHGKGILTDAEFAAAKASLI